MCSCGVLFRLASRLAANGHLWTMTTPGQSLQPESESPGACSSLVLRYHLTDFERVKALVDVMERTRTQEVTQVADDGWTSGER